MRVTAARPKKSKTVVREEDLIGKVLRYDAAHGVAIVTLSAPANVGDHVRIGVGKKSFVQFIESLAVNQLAVECAGSGRIAAMRVDHPVEVGATIVREPPL
ncbi:MAG: hypothetical protein Q7R81_04960 [Candidatus Peregrinibacteria bacterium]|nr:hypothetical protein [Candidatus Peregrinibacteria bacterium]